MKLDALEPDFKAIAEQIIAEAAAAGIRLVVTSTRRTIAEQNRLYAQGRTAPGKIVTKAKGGQSPHNFGLAFDFCPLNESGGLDWNAPKSVWAKVGEIAESHGMTWGGHFKTLLDLPHIEHPRWRGVRAEWQAGRVQIP